MRAVQEAFYYQRDVVGDASGALSRPYIAKLAPLFEIVKISNSRYQKKFLSNFCSKVDFDLKKLDTTRNPPEHLLFARFVSQNLAFFDYNQMAELVPTIGCMERIVAATGTVVAHSIETEILPSQLGPPSDGVPPIPMADATAPMSLPLQQVNQVTLRLLATAAATLSMLWEARTYLRHLYGVNAHVRKEGKGAAKELNKSASKNAGISGEKFWDAVSRNMASLDSGDHMIAKCREFATLLAIDDEFRVGQYEDAEDDSLEGGADDNPGAATAAQGTQRPLKRKSSVSGANPPKKPRGRKSGSAKKRASATPDEDMDWE